ncbi:MAG: TlyA family RNA methyltransferase [Elusimicrobia bacterium]|nr:TlyA family RNA methyltransferase [Elusimicrobiota bacterium]
MAKETGYVSRGAIKLRGALASAGIDPEGKVVIDIGSSHGGFVQVMLLANAALVYAVDVGKGLLDWKLRNFEKVVVMENTNAKDLKAEMFERRPDIGLIDVSFISLKKVLPVAFGIVSESILALAKPQFEATYEETSRGRGVILSGDIQRRILDDIRDSVQDSAWELAGIYPAQIKGRTGNQEFFMHYNRKGPGGI